MPISFEIGINLPIDKHMAIINLKSHDQSPVGFRLDNKTIKEIRQIALESGNTLQDIYEALIKAGIEKAKEENSAG